MDLDTYKVSVSPSNGANVISIPSSGNSLTDETCFADDLWYYSLPVAPTAPTLPVVCNKSTVGALNSDVNNSNATNKLWLVGGEAYDNRASYSSYIIVDRLTHQGGLLSSSTSTQTTNLPTAALTRYTSGNGVMIGVTIYTATASTIATITASYTNQSGTSGRTTVGTLFPKSASARLAGNFMILPLQSGDSGARSVESVTLSVATGTGTFGVCLFRPLILLGRSSISCYDRMNFIDGSFMGGIPEVEDNACITAIAKSDLLHGTTIASTRCNLVLYEETI